MLDVAANPCVHKRTVQIQMFEKTQVKQTLCKWQDFAVQRANHKKSAF